MHLQAWDPYYFSPFGVETKLRSYSMVGARISSPHFSPLFSFFCFKYSFRFFYVKSCLSRNYSFHSHRVSLAGPNFCGFFCCFSFSPFHLLCVKFRFLSSVLRLFLSNRILFCLSEVQIMFTQRDFKNH